MEAFLKGVVNGTRSSSNLHVPNFEPRYENFGAPPLANPGTTSAYVKKKADFEVRGHTGEVKLVDVTVTGTFPPNMDAFKARTYGFLAQRSEMTKAKETLGWTKNPKVEFVPFAADIYGAVAPQALAFQSWLRIQATPREGNDLESRVFGVSHPGRLMDQVCVQLIKGCAAACYKRSYGEPSVAKKTS